MKRTTAPGAVGGAYVDDNPGGGIVGTLLIAADRNLEQEEICAPIEGVGIVLSGSDSGQLWKAMRKLTKERGKEVGEIFALMDRKAPVAFGTGTEDTYFPGKCLTSITSYEDISETNWPDLVPYLRARKVIFKDGISGEISAPGVTNWSITSNVVTLTFTNDADHIALLNALSEDQTVHGSFSNWRTITIPVNIGSVTAGTYNITGITPASRTITFALTAANGSGAVTSTAEFYPFRIAGSSTTARLFSTPGMTVHGANDANGYFVAGGMRRRGYFQGHYHQGYYAAEANSGGSGARAGGTGSNTILDLTDRVRAAITDGTNGTPRIAKETHGPALTVHIYVHGGRYVA